SKVAEGDDAEIWVDTSQMHLFDPATGENLTIDVEHAGRVPSLEEGNSATEQREAEGRVADEQTAAADGS
ncbi:MAG: hypothetical protein Q8O61_01085, partial [Nocardioides sp.]|nr:hypothetical protein [Nocardioides sp.]